MHADEVFALRRAACWAISAVSWALKHYNNPYSAPVNHSIPSWLRAGTAPPRHIPPCRIARSQLTLTLSPVPPFAIQSPYVVQKTSNVLQGARSAFCPARAHETGSCRHLAAGWDAKTCRITIKNDFLYLFVTGNAQYVPQEPGCAGVADALSG